MCSRVGCGVSGGVGEGGGSPECVCVGGGGTPISLARFLPRSLGASPPLSTSLAPKFLPIPALPEDSSYLKLSQAGWVCGLEPPEWRPHPCPALFSWGLEQVCALGQPGHLVCSPQICLLCCSAHYVSCQTANQSGKAQGPPRRPQPQRLLPVYCSVGRNSQFGIEFFSEIQEVVCYLPAR